MKNNYDVRLIVLDVLETANSSVEEVIKSFLDTGYSLLGFDFDSNKYTFVFAKNIHKASTKEKELFQSEEFDRMLCKSVGVE